MMPNIRRFKPGVARKVHIFCAAGLWTFIGFFLLYRGIVLLSGAEALWLALPGVLAGCVKSLLVLDRSARRGLERIELFSDNTCIGAIYSWKTWLLVLAMMVMGMMLRRFALSPMIVGTLCIAIGWALVFSSRLAWMGWATWEKRR